MLRINIKYKNKLRTVSFEDIEELNQYLFYKCACDYSHDLVKNIWNLNLGKSISVGDYRFSIQSKRRTGDKIVNNYLIGEQL